MNRLTTATIVFAWCVQANAQTHTFTFDSYADGHEGPIIEEGYSIVDPACDPDLNYCGTVQNRYSQNPNFLYDVDYGSGEFDMARPDRKAFAVHGADVYATRFGWFCHDGSEPYAYVTAMRADGSVFSEDDVPLGEGDWLNVVEATFNVYDFCGDGAALGVIVDNVTVGPSAKYGLRHPVEFDLDPASEANEIDAQSTGVVAVALLTTSRAAGDGSDFNAMNAVPHRLRFGPGEAHHVHSSLTAVDVDGDNDLDMLVEFPIQDAGILCDDTEVVLSGRSYSQEEFVGYDTVNMMNCDGGCH